MINFKRVKGENKYMSKVIKYIVIGAVVLFVGSAAICGIMDAGKNKTTTMDNTNISTLTPTVTAISTITPEPTQNLTTQYYDIVLAALKDSATDVVYTPGTNNLRIEFKESMNLTGKMTVKAMWLDITNTLHKIKDSEVPNVNVDFIVNYDQEDKYGNMETVKVMSASFTTDTIEKINFDNFLKENIPDVADDYWQAPIITNILND